MYLTAGISRVESLFNLFGMILVFLFILGIAYLTTRMLGDSKLLKQRNKNIDIIETYKLGPNKFIQIIKVGEKYVAIGIGKDEIEYLTELPKEQLILDSILNQRTNSPESFKDILAKLGKKEENKNKN